MARGPARPPAPAGFHVPHHCDDTCSDAGAQSANEDRQHLQCLSSCNHHQQRVATAGRHEQNVAVDWSATSHGCEATQDERGGATDAGRRGSDDYSAAAAAARDPGAPEALDFLPYSPRGSFQLTSSEPDVNPTDPAVTAARDPARRPPRSSLVLDRFLADDGPWSTYNLRREAPTGHLHLHQGDTHRGNNARGGSTSATSRKK